MSTENDSATPEENGDKVTEAMRLVTVEMAAEAAAVAATKLSLVYEMQQQYV